jgi:NADH-quinone oxidoreductase subunit J
LTSGQQEVLSKTTLIKKLAAAIACIAGVVVFGAMLFMQQFKAAALSAPSESDSSFISIETIGHHMLSTDVGGYLLPFEAVSILLLACIVGGLIIARKR